MSLNQAGSFQAKILNKNLKGKFERLNLSPFPKVKDICATLSLILRGRGFAFPFHFVQD